METTRPRSFCVFILSHGRPDGLRTLKALQRQGYTGPWRIVVDSDDRCVAQYQARYGHDQVVVFDKDEIAPTFDLADTLPERRVAVFARNACWKIARDLGYSYFLQLDDDYSSFLYREQRGARLYGIVVRSLDDLFAAMLDFLDDTGAATVALAQGGDMLGGVLSRRWQAKILRKAMNTFFCRTDAEWRFMGRVNEDVNAYTVLSTRGLLFFTTMYAMITQARTQSRPGGMTEEYLASGTYVKSFYTVMMCPSGAHVEMMGETHRRIHHRINWRTVAPLILAESYRKPQEASA